jgi:hypothetical protein
MDTNLWMMEDLQRVINAERLAEAEAGRLAAQARGASGRPVRVVMADALRALASILDRDGVTSKPTQRRLARVY